MPHDGSRSSDRALDKAIELAKALGSEIILVNIVDDRFIPPSTTLAFLSDKTSLEDAKMKIIKYVKQGSEAMLKDKLEKAKSQGVNIRHIVAVDPPSDEIVKAAEDEKAGLIITGKSQVEGVGDKGTGKYCKKGIRGLASSCDGCLLEILIRICLWPNRNNVKIIKSRDELKIVFLAETLIVLTTLKDTNISFYVSKSDHLQRVYLDFQRNVVLKSYCP